MPATTDPPTQTPSGELRNRKDKGKEVRSLDENKKIMAKNLIQQMPSWVPDNVKTNLDKLFDFVWPVFLAMCKLVDILSPLVPIVTENAKKFWTFLQPYQPMLMAPMLCGLVFIFFGGYFVLTISAFEAFRLSGWDSFCSACTTLYANYEAFKKKSEEDDKEDLDGDGIADVLQIEQKTLITRKVGVFMRSTDPVIMSQALTSIYTGFVGVVATLKIQFAKTITLGATIGECIHGPIDSILEPILYKVVPADYHKWVEVGGDYVCRSVGCSIAWFFQRIISALHAAIRGSYMFTEAFADFTKFHGYTTLSEGFWDEIFAIICSLFGLYLQITSMFMMPWILTFLLMPIVTLEWFLQLSLSFM